MKAKIFSIVLAGLFVAGNIGLVLGENKSVYKNTDYNVSDNTITTEVYNGEQDGNLVPVIKHIIKCSEDGTPVEKTIYKWNDSKGWIAHTKYTYYYDFVGNLNALGFAQWDYSKHKWNNDPYLTMYIYTDERDLLSINR